MLAYSLVGDLLTQGRDAVLLDGLLQQLRQRLHRLLEIGLVVLEHARVVVAVQAGQRDARQRAQTTFTREREHALERHRVRPLERDPGSGEGVDGLFGELDLDPGEIRRELHLLHLLLRLGVEVPLQFGRELVVGPTVVVL